VYVINDIQQPQKSSIIKPFLSSLVNNTYQKTSQWPKVVGTSGFALGFLNQGLGLIPRSDMELLLEVLLYPKMDQSGGSRISLVSKRTPNTPCFCCKSYLYSIVKQLKHPLKKLTKKSTVSHII